MATGQATSLNLLQINITFTWWGVLIFTILIYALINTLVNQQ